MFLCWHAAGCKRTVATLTAKMSVIVISLKCILHEYLGKRISDYSLRNWMKSIRFLFCRTFPSREVEKLNFAEDGTHNVNYLVKIYHR
jgi:hypothetical protein